MALVLHFAAVKALNDGVEVEQSPPPSPSDDCTNEIKALQILVDEVKTRHPTPADDASVDEELSTFEDSELRFQSALSALMQDKDARDLARTDGVRFQNRYRLTNKQMISLALVAIHTGEATLHRELRDLTRLNDDSAVIGSCCCSCP